MKKAVNETPVEEPKSFGQRLPQRGRDFINGFHVLRLPHLAPPVYQQIGMVCKNYFGGVNGGIEPSLTESQSAVLPLHYEHRSGQ